MTRIANIIILCEDRQHEAFARRFLQRSGQSNRSIRVKMAPPGRGSAEQFVREHYPEEVQFYRSRQHRVSQALIVLIDADGRNRFNELSRALRTDEIDDRGTDERIAVFSPSSTIETWLAYLAGQDVNESDSYPGLQKQRDCQQYVDALVQMCDSNSLRVPSPPSLQQACNEYQSRLSS